MKLFVYGMLLTETQHPAQRAALDGYRLWFDGTLATVVPAERKTAYGAVLDVPDEQRWLDHYDRIEAVDYGLYRRERVTVHTEEGPVQAWVYIKNLTAPGYVTSGSFYHEIIRKGYMRFDLPMEALDEALAAAPPARCQACGGSLPGVPASTDGRHRTWCPDAEA